MIWDIATLFAGRTLHRWLEDGQEQDNTQPDFASYLRQYFICVKSMKKLIWRGVKPFNWRCLADGKQTFMTTFKSMIIKFTVQLQKALTTIVISHIQCHSMSSLQSCFFIFSYAAGTLRSVKSKTCHVSKWILVNFDNWPIMHTLY